MRRMTVAIMPLALMICLTGSVAAQGPSNPLKFYLFGGASLPQSDMKDGFKMGYHGGGALGLTLIPGLEGQARVAYHSFDPDWPDDVEADGGRFTALLYGVEAKMNLGQAGTGLFLSAGAGYAKLDITDITWTHNGVEQTSETDLDDQTYFSLAAGVEFDRMFIEGRYVKIIDDIVLNELSTDVDEEGSIVFIPISIGFKF